MSSNARNLKRVRTPAATFGRARAGNFAVRACSCSEKLRGRRKNFEAAVEYSAAASGLRHSSQVEAFNSSFF
jgi:hypothetical protein